MTHDEFLAFVDAHLGRVFEFAYRITNSQQQAESVVTETFLRAYVGQEHIRPKDPKSMAAWLLKIATHSAEPHLRHGTGLSFQLLDDTIRSDPTQITKTDRLTEPETNYLLWELKQGCMTAVLACLSPGERLAFTLSVHMRMRSREAAATLGITRSAFKVRLSRAQKKISSYLAPRCEHVDPGNPCHCPSRLGVAIRKGFIRQVPAVQVSLRKKPVKAFDNVTAVRDVVAIFESLPEPESTDDFRQAIQDELRSGRWDEVFNRSKLP